MSGPDPSRTPDGAGDAPDADGGPEAAATGPDAAAAGADDESGDTESGDTESGDEILEVLDVDDEMAAMGDDDDPLAGDPLAVELAATRQERDDYLDALRRLQADFENYKKRAQKLQSDAAARGGESLVERLLPALDTADLAMAHGGGEQLAQVWTALIDALASEGLERIAPDGGPFDPNLHDAVAHEPGEGGQEVAEVLRAGYAWRGRVLRAAMVKVRG